jgi:hypothetical protein
MKHNRKQLSYPIRFPTTPTCRRLVADQNQIDRQLSGPLSDPSSATQACHKRTSYYSKPSPAKKSQWRFLCDGFFCAALQNPLETLIVGQIYGVVPRLTIHPTKRKHQALTRAQAAKADQWLDPVS